MSIVFINLFFIIKKRPPKAIYIITFKSISYIFLFYCKYFFKRDFLLKKYTIHVKTGIATAKMTNRIL